MEAKLGTRDFAVRLVELGPGTGELMIDILRTLLTLRKSLKQTHISFIEMSEKLKQVQQDKVLNMLKKHGLFMAYQSNSEDSGNSVENFVCEQHDRYPLTLSWANTLSDLAKHQLPTTKTAKTANAAKYITSID